MAMAGRWTNRLGSIMELRVSGDALSGTYKTAVGGDKAKSRSWKLFGKVAGDLLSFIVVYGKGQDASIAAWTGRYFPEEKAVRGRQGKPERIATVWCLADRWTAKKSGKSLKRVPTEDWNHVLTNADIFTRE
jgi:hypothetical protein